MPAGLYGTWSGGVIQGTVTGKMTPGGSFTFLEELIETGHTGTPWEYTRMAVITGAGSFVSPTQATGTANITTECRTTDDTTGSMCGDNSTSDSFTGSINWEFNGTGATP